MKVSDLVKWIIKNRRGRAFQDWTANQLILSIDKAIAAETLCYTTDKHGRFTGIAIADKNEEQKTMEVVAILTTEPSALGKMAAFYKLHAAGYSIITHDKHGNKKFHNTEQFIERLIRYGRT